MKDHLLGFDIGGTKCAVLLGKRSPEGLDIVYRHAFPTETDRGPDAALSRMESEAQIGLHDLAIPTDDIGGIGISCGGPLDNRKGVILSPPNLPGWDDVRIKERFETYFGIPVRLENDADACAVAEWMWGAGRGCHSMVFLTFGTGMGAGLILDGRLYSGAHGLAGEVGHVRLENDGPVGYGKRGSFEGFCSGGGIAQLAAAVAAEHFARGEEVGFCTPDSDPRKITALAVAEAARRGDKAALDIFEVVASNLGRGLAILADILDPEMIVIGSIYTRNHDLLWPTANQVLQLEAIQSKGREILIAPAALGDKVGDYACLALAAHSEEGLK